MRLYLDEYEFTVEYLKGKNNHIANIYLTNQKSGCGSFVRYPKKPFAIEPTNRPKLSIPHFEKFVEIFDF